jgi:chromosomal replication initiation ATPase DnaA
MNRGRRGEAIFSYDQDFIMFTELLKETSEMWKIRIAAYCLMPNHYHMLVQTPEANISRSMRHLNGVYTQRYNSRHKCDGQLFRGRYKSILIDRIKETYGAKKINKGVPSSRELLPDKSRIFKEVCKAYDTRPSEILKMRRGKMNEARNVAIYLTRKLRRDTLKEIASQFDIDNDSTVSSVMERMKKRFAEDRNFLRRMEKIAESIKISQERT